MNDLPDTLERLAERLEALERRVAVLEKPALEPAITAPFAEQPAQVSDPSTSSLFAFSGGTFTVLGKALLGIAGAYLLRAVEQSTDLPKLVVAGVAIVYALIWLVWAVRTPRERWFESTVFACTSSAILAPMLWELTLTFNLLWPAAAAAILAGFVAVGAAVAWRQDRAPAITVAFLSAIASAFALALGSHALLPFTAVILFIVALCEESTIHVRQTGTRVIAAIAADGMIWAILFIYAGPETARLNYPHLGTLALVTPALVLFLIDFAEVAVKTAVQRKTISMFETVQTTVAFVLVAIGFAWLLPSDFAYLGWACLAFAVIVSMACVQVFARSEEPGNYLVFSWWAFALFVAGALLGFPSSIQTILLSAGAIGATILGVRMKRSVLQYQGSLLLLLVAAVSGAARSASGCLIGTLPDTFPWGSLCVAVCAAICYVLEPSHGNELWRPQALRLVTMFLAVSAVCALLVDALASLMTLAVPLGPHHIALIRTGVVCFIALALAFCGRRWQRVELTRISYGALAFVTVKLLVEDLRNPKLLFISASIFLVATTLLVVPRLSRLARRS
jgi:hypothetical protein